MKINKEKEEFFRDTRDTKISCELVNGLGDLKIFIVEHIKNYIESIYINSCNPTISEHSVRYENNYVTLSHNRDKVKILSHKGKLGNVIAQYKLRLTSNSIIMDDTNEELDFGFIDDLAENLIKDFK